MNMMSAIEQDIYHNSKSRLSAANDHPSVFTDIYQEDINIAVWERDLSTEIKTSVENFLQSHGNYRTSLNVTPETVIEKLIHSERGFLNSQALCNDISELVEMFCVLFDLR